MSINANSTHDLRYFPQLYLAPSLITLTQFPSPHLPLILCSKFLTIMPVTHGWSKMSLVVVMIIIVVVVIIIITTITQIGRFNFFYTLYFNLTYM